MTNRHEIAHSPVNLWLVLAGVQPHGITPRRPKTAKHFQGAAGYKPPAPHTVTLASAHKKTRRGIRACLRAGMLSNYEIRMKLIERGFYITRHGTTLYPSRFNVYVRLIREQLGLVRRAKKEWVLSMWDEGHEIAHIIQRLNTNEDYVIQVLRRDGRVMGLTKTEGRDATNT